jgi:hypothetical protein
MVSGSRSRQPFLRMPRITAYGRAGAPTVKTARRWIGAPRSLDASKKPRIWSALPTAGNGRARSSAEEHCLHTAGVAGSNPAAPTIAPGPLDWVVVCGADTASWMAAGMRAVAGQDAAFSHSDHRETVCLRPASEAHDEILLLKSTEPRSLNVFIERVCPYLVRAVTHNRLNDAPSAPAAISRRKGVSSMRPLRSAGAVIKWRAQPGTGSFSRLE